jgi:hypothetical protein
MDVYEYFHTILINFLPIAVILFFAFDPSKFTFFATTCLGRLFAVISIIYYTHLNYLHGLLICVVIILFYQTNHIRLLHKLEGFAPSYSMSEYDSLYKPESLDTNNDAIAKEHFRKEHCDGNQLLFKQHKVRSESVPCVFPEVKFTGRPCNICDRNCSVSIRNDFIK